MTRDLETMLLYGGLAALAAFFLFPQAFGRAVGGVVVGAVETIYDATTGAVIGIGEALGIPATDVEKCAQYIEAGDSWNASFYCPAGTFLKYESGEIVDYLGNVVGFGAPAAAKSIVTFAIEQQEQVTPESLEQPGYVPEETAA